MDMQQTLDTLRDKIKNNCSTDTLDELSTHLNDIEREYRHVVRDRQKLEEENEQLKTQIKPKKDKRVRVRCPCTTAKGTQCRKFCLEGIETCKVHSKPLKPAKPAKKPRVKRQLCSGINIRGNPCRNKCMDDKTYCERHDPDAPVITKKTKRNKP
jgi:FtsZ-binding cell division protein ZapB